MGEFSVVLYILWDLSVSFHKNFIWARGQSFPGKLILQGLKPFFEFCNCAGCIHCCLKPSLVSQVTVKEFFFHYYSHNLHSWQVF